MTCYASLSWPPPFYGREFLVDVSGYDCMTERDTTKQVVVTLNSLEDDDLWKDLDAHEVDASS